MKSSWAFVVVTAIVLALDAIPASASEAVNRTWVSATGSDSGACSISAPCASFQYALSQTPAGGEIDCLTPGDFGGASRSLTIEQSVSIVCDRISNGGISGPSDLIVVSAPSGATVYLSGLDLLTSASSARGVVVTSGPTIYIVRCTIRGSNLFAQIGVAVQSSTNPTRVVIKDSIVANNGEAGVVVGDASGVTNSAGIINTMIDGNQNIALQANNAGGTASVVAAVRTLLTGSPTGLELDNGASGEFIGPSNTVAGAIIGTTTSVSFK
jgi:hypothetical protein